MSDSPTVRNGPPAPTLAAPRHLNHASKPLQDMYWILRSRRNQALIRLLPQIEDAFPDFAHASRELRTFLRLYPRYEFRIFRPEDIEATDSTRDPGSTRFIR